MPTTSDHSSLTLRLHHKEQRWGATTTSGNIMIDPDVMLDIREGQQRQSSNYAPFSPVDTPKRATKITQAVLSSRYP